MSDDGPLTWHSLPRHLRDPVHITSILGRVLLSGMSRRRDESQRWLRW